jgi:hypothetical protein
VNNAGEVKAVDPDSGGAKGRKLAEFALIPPDVLWEIAELFGIGVQKYGNVGNRPNYQAGYPWSWSYSAMQRHLWQFWSGEDLDPESGKHHLTHAAWHCMALLWFTLHEAGTDDRPK